jgi:hypothetical protein
MDDGAGALVWLCLLATVAVLGARLVGAGL